MFKRQYTIVQHAGYAIGKDPQFCRGVQSARVVQEAQLAAVERAGGRVFRSLSEAENYCSRQNYPMGYHGLQPVAEGRFSDEHIEGQPIYIPPPEEL
jgi:hypothetical protein